MPAYERDWNEVAERADSRAIKPRTPEDFPGEYWQSFIEPPQGGLLVIASRDDDGDYSEDDDSTTGAKWWLDDARERTWMTGTTPAIADTEDE